jgi:hypothetical protein
MAEKLLLPFCILVCGHSGRVDLFKVFTYQGLDHDVVRSPGRSRATIVMSYLTDEAWLSTYALARPVIPEPMIVIGIFEDILKVVGN